MKSKVIKVLFKIYNDGLQQKTVDLTNYYNELKNLFNTHKTKGIR
jgi:hypothetical protein